MKRSVFLSSFAAALLLASCGKTPTPKPVASETPSFLVNFRNDEHNQYEVSVAGVTLVGKTDPSISGRGSFVPSTMSHAMDLTPLGLTGPYEVHYSVNPIGDAKPCTWRKDQCQFPAVTFTAADVKQNGGIITLKIPKDK